jgi:hypothetical protein
MVTPTQPVRDTAHPKIPPAPAKTDPRRLPVQRPDRKLQSPRIWSPPPSGRDGQVESRLTREQLRGTLLLPISSAAERTSGEHRSRRTRIPSPRRSCIRAHIALATAVASYTYTQSRSGYPPECARTRIGRLARWRMTALSSKQSLLYVTACTILHICTSTP